MFTTSQAGLSLFCCISKVSVIVLLASQSGVCHPLVLLAVSLVNQVSVTVCFCYHCLLLLAAKPVSVTLGICLPRNALGMLSPSEWYNGMRRVASDGEGAMMALN